MDIPLILGIGIVLGATAWIIKSAKNNYVLPWNRGKEEKKGSGESKETIDKKKVK